MKISVALIPLVIALLAPSCAPPTPTPQASTKTVSIDEFFDGQIASLPLTLSIPENYEHAKGLDVGVTYSYWMPKDEVAEVRRTGDLPTDSGYVYGKISMSVGYDPRTEKFTSEDQFDERLKQQGATILKKERFDAKGYPVMSHVVRMKDGMVICQMYVGMRISTNALYIAYRPPNNDRKVGMKTWRRMLESLRR